MARTLTRVTRTGVALATAGTLVGAGVVTATPAGAALKGTVLHVGITDHRLYVDGPTTFPAGRVKIVLDAAGGDRGVELARLHQGYSWKEFRGDSRTMGENLFGPGGDTDAGLRALNNIVDNVTFYGGLYAPEGKVRKAVLRVPTPGNRYVLYDDSGLLPKRPTHLTVTAPEGPQKLPATDGKLIAKQNMRFGGDDSLASKGFVRLKNKAATSPHFFSFQRVTESTSRQDVIDSFNSSEQPDFLLKGSQDSDVISPGKAVNLKLKLPPGKYAVMCFFPNLQTGTPHAIMGMVKMVHLT